MYILSMDPRIGSYINKKIGDFRAGIQKGIKTTSPVVQRFVNEVSSIPALSVLPGGAAIRSGPTIGGIAQSLIKPVYQGAQDTISSARVFLDPRQTPVALSPKGVSAYAGTLGNAAKTGVNALGVSKLKPVVAATTGVIGAGLNMVQRKDPLQGFYSGLEQAPTMSGVGEFTNPVVNTLLGRVSGVAKNPFVQNAITRATSGLANIPEGIIQKKITNPNDPYTLPDAGFDFGLGVVLGDGAQSSSTKATRMPLNRENIISRPQGLQVTQEPKILSPTMGDQTLGIPIQGQIQNQAQGLPQMKQGLNKPTQQMQIKKDSLKSGEAFDVSIPKSGLNKIGTPPEAQNSGSGIIDNIKNKLNTLYTEAIDRFHPLSQVTKGTGQEQAMKNALTQHYGAGSTSTYHVDYELAPILKNTDINDLRALTIAKRDLELAQRGIKGSDAKAAEQVLNELKNKYGDTLKKLEESASKLYEYQRNLVKTYLVNTGVISKEAFAAMSDANKSYVPFKRVMDEVDGFLGMTPQNKNMGSVGSQSIIKGIKGSERDIIDPLQSIVENTYKIVSLGRRQQVASTISKLADKLPTVVQKYDGEIGQRPHISVMENGKKINYLVPQDVAEAAKGLNEESLNTIIKILSAPTKLFRATATGLNPEFALPNTVRDLQSAFVNTGMNPLSFLSGFAHLLKKDKVYQDFLKAGGQTSSISLDRKFLAQKVEDISARKNGNILSKTLSIIPKKPSDIINILQTIGEYSEQPTRIGMYEKAYKDAIKRGVAEEQAKVIAAGVAQEGTVNFARSGSKMQAVNSLVAFLNARAQGVDKLVRTAKRDPAGFAFRMALTSQVPAVLSYLWNRNFNAYNDERVVSKYDKENNFIIMLSDKPIPQLGGAQFIKIPKGDVGRFANPTENFLAYLDGKGENKAIEDIAKSFGALSPINNFGDIIPTAIKPVVENTANFSFFRQQPIVPDYKQSLPAQYQFDSKTAPQYKLLGKVTGQSPAKLENLTSGYLTGYEKITSPLLEKVATEIDPSVARAQAPQGQDVNRIPIMRRFLGGEKKTTEEQMIANEKQARSIDFQINDIKGAVNRGDMPADEAIKRIQQMRKQQSELDPNTVNNSVYFMKDGKLKEVNMGGELVRPILTGNKSLDNKMLDEYSSNLDTKASNIALLYSVGKAGRDQTIQQLTQIYNEKAIIPSATTGKLPKYNLNKFISAKLTGTDTSDINNKINDVYSQYKEGKISAADASTLMDSLTAQKNILRPKSTGGIKRRKAKVIKFKTAKLKKIKVNSVKIPKVKKLRLRKLKIPKVKIANPKA